MRPAAPVTATSDATELADWFEARTLETADQNVAIQDLVRLIHRGGSASDVDEDRRLVSDREESAAEDAFNELQYRAVACGGDPYPFDIRSDYVQLRDTSEGSVYLFLLLLSIYGKDAGPAEIEAEKLFEELCAAAIRSYFGGEALGARAYLFGFPRRLTPTGFASAVDDLCLNMREGIGNRQRPDSADQKDAKLDVVAWRDFPDLAPGKLIGFGQCATGRNWTEKLTDLQPQDFCTLWMADRPAVWPIRAFFTPFRVPQRKWATYSVRAGILFDRCRIAYHLHALSVDLRDQCRAWVSGVRSEASKL